MIDRRHLISTAVAMVAVGSKGQAQTPAAAVGDGDLWGLFDQIAASLKPRDQTPRGIDEARAAVAPGRAALARMDPSRLSTLARFNWQTALQGLEREARLVDRFGFGGFGAAFSPYVLTSTSGAYLGLVGTGQPLTASRVADLARDISGQTARLNADASQGIVPPRRVLQATLKAILALPSQDPPQIQTALGAQVEALAALQTRPPAADGVGRFRDGGAYYALALQLALGRAVDPDAAHTQALQAVASLQVRADALLRGQGLTRGSVADRLRALARDPRYAYSNDDAGRDRAVAGMNRTLAQIAPRLPAVFGELKLPPAEVRRMSRADEAAARAGYRLLPDATGVAAYYVDLANVTGRPDWTLASVAHHELLPGHMVQHPLQVAARPHALRLRYAGAFFEGWANYAQHLAQELGAFDGDPRGEIGMLQWLMFRIGRAVIDTGIHARGWSRARAIQAMTALQGQSIAFISIEADIDRMIVNPGQLAAEGLATLDLIVMGKAAGPGGLVAFHRAILQNGPWPIGLLPEISAAKY